MEKYLDEYSSYKWVCIPLNGKIPILKKWNQFDHTPDAKAFANRNIGVLTGKASGITILDVDIKDNGLVYWKQIESLYPLIDTPIVKTPSGGLHIYFKYEKSLSSSSRLILKRNDTTSHRIGWDILNDNRQAVVPPSSDMQINGLKRYKWIQSPSKCKISKMPKWLVDYIKLSTK